VEGEAVTARRSLTSRLRWTIERWTIFLSVTAALLVAVIGLHALTDDTASAATLTSATATFGTPASDMEDALIATSTMSAAADAEDVLTCGLLALLCVAALAAILIRMRGGAALTFSAGGPTQPAPPLLAFRDRQVFAGLTALSIARI
jgi:hypothetical protein